MGGSKKVGVPKLLPKVFTPHICLFFRVFGIYPIKAKIPIIAVTANAPSEDKRLAFGVDRKASGEA